MLVDVCDVWWAHLSDLRPRHLTLLDGTELGRRSALRLPVDRVRFSLGAALLRLALGHYLGQTPAAVHIDRTCHRCGLPHGRPRAAAGGLHVSVSHSVQLVGVAVTAAGPVGVDVERVIDLDVDALAATVLTSEERAELTVLGDFFRLWTRKEATLKATGDGLLKQMSDVVVSSPREPARLLALGGRAVEARLEDLSPGPGYAGAVAVLAPAAVVREHDAGPLLHG